MLACKTIVHSKDLWNAIRELWLPLSFKQENLLKLNPTLQRESVSCIFWLKDQFKKLHLLKIKKKKKTRLGKDYTALALLTSTAVAVHIWTLPKTSKLSKPYQALFPRVTIAMIIVIKHPGNENSYQWCSSPQSFQPHMSHDTTVSVSKWYLDLKDIIPNPARR